MHPGLAALGLWTAAGWLASSFAAERRDWQRTAALVALVGLSAAPNPQRLPPLIREGDAIAARMPRFHSEYARGRRFAGFCADLDGPVPAGSNVFGNARQILEAVCPNALHEVFLDQS